MERASLAALAEVGWTRHGNGPNEGAGARAERELVILVPGGGPAAARRGERRAARARGGPAAASRSRSARSRHADDPADLHRAGAEALLAANVAEARGLAELSFEETGAYRLLLPAMSEDPAELQRFHDETVAPLVAYDEQYETELVRTLESFLDADGNVAGAAERLFTHRHTDPLPARAREGADRARRELDRRPRAALARPQGDARARHRAARGPGAGARRRGRAACREERRTAD